ncbi:hypothetical protein Tco_1534896 [Tanacetum coccineum]
MISFFAVHAAATATVSFQLQAAEERCDEYEVRATHLEKKTQSAELAAQEGGSPATLVACRTLAKELYGDEVPSFHSK